ncbi:hypothetical protein B296_00012599 [Ensete ventricosum]|uniref:Uncharacterized protein n=1 Tax=Ensete ventricosum TaxID=4639 RepID=A0A427AA65_ENSVE|nr:hypothetical protein B296_00012599 [Ensete ventricosum]
MPLYAVSGRAADLAQVRPNPQRSYDRPDTGKANTLTCGRMPHRKDDGHGGGVRRHGKPQGQPGCQESTTDPSWNTSSRLELHHSSSRPPEPYPEVPPSGRAPTLYRVDRGRAGAREPEPAVLAQQTQGRNTSTRQAPNSSLTFLALGGLMSPECPFGDSGTEHHPEPDHPRPTEEATVVVPTPNRFWRMMTDPGFPSPASNPTPFTVTAEAFLSLTSQVQALAGMVQTIVPYLPQLAHSMAHQSAPPATPPQTESPAAPNRGIPPDVGPPQPQVVEARVASPTPTPVDRKVAPTIRYRPSPTSTPYQLTPLIL